MLIPRIPIMIPTDFSFIFKRLQLPARFAFTVIINKAQKQSLHVVGLNLANSCFLYGMLRCRDFNKNVVHSYTESTNFVYKTRNSDK